MRIAAYNVSAGPDPDALGRVLAEIGAEVVCVLEAPRTARLRRIAQAADLVVAARTGRRGSGTAVLAGEGVHVLATAEVALSTPRDVPRRAATHVIVSVGGRRLSVTALQLGLRPEVRRTNLDELTEFLASVDAPTVLGCDLNESPRAAVARILAERYLDAHAVAGAGGGLTYPTADPSVRQDFVFVDPALRPVRCTTLSSPATRVASHHRPVVVDLAEADAEVEPA